VVTLSNVELLKRVALFNSLSVSQAQLLLSATEKKRYKRNECIVEEGTKSNKLFVILSGTARVTLNTGNGRELSLALIQTGEFFGEMSLLDGQVLALTES
jgi:CRP-like cAMP-binding protein